jgi:hypothetical protein
MAGDSSNASVWPDADVYWTTNLDATNPATVDDPFGVDWDLVGLLDGDAGFVQTRDEDTNDLYAWGGILVRTTRQHFKQTVTFTALEDNDTTRGLIYPGSAAGEIVVPRPQLYPGKIAFETREGTKVRRLISAFKAEVSINGDITDAEGDMTRYELVATVFPDAETDPPTLFIEKKTASGSCVRGGDLHGVVGPRRNPSKPRHLGEPRHERPSDHRRRG